MTSTNPYISIIIPHFNGIEVLSECIKSLSKTDFQSYEIIVVDNASSDGSQNWIKKNYPEIILLESESNYGYAGGCNKGSQIAMGEYLVFLNNDTTQEPDWLTHLFNCFQTKDNIAAVQPKILNYYDRTIFDYAGGAGGLMDKYCYPFARGRVFLNQEKDVGQYDDSRECFWASGTSMMVKKELFQLVGGFDEVFFSHMEEIDLCWRLQALGYKIWVEPRSVIFHKNATTLPMFTHRKYYLNHRNSLLMLFSNHNILDTIYYGAARILLEFVAICYSIIKIDFNHITGIIHSFIWLLINPMTIYKKRRSFNNLNKSKVASSFHNKSIVLSYYIFNKKTYSEIASNAD